MWDNLKYHQKKKDVRKNKNDKVYKDLTVKLKSFSFKLFYIMLEYNWLIM